MPRGDGTGPRGMGGGDGTRSMGGCSAGPRSRCRGQRNIRLRSKGSRLRCREYSSRRMIMRETGSGIREVARVDEVSEHRGMRQ